MLQRCTHLLLDVNLQPFVSLDTELASGCRVRPRNRQLWIWSLASERGHFVPAGCFLIVSFAFQLFPMISVLSYDLPFFYLVSDASLWFFDLQWLQMTSYVLLCFSKCSGAFLQFLMICLCFSNLSSLGLALLGQWLIWVPASVHSNFLPVECFLMISFGF